MRFLKDRKAASYQVEIIIVLVFVVVAGIVVWRLFGEQIGTRLREIMGAW